MDKLVAFAKHYNEHEFVYPQSTEVRNELLGTMTDMFRSSFANCYLTEKEYESGVFGCSQLGKPSIVTAWDYFYGVQKHPTSFAKQRKFYGGHMFELDACYYLMRMGYEVQHQVSVEISELIKGHPDFVVTDKQTQRRFVIECKHVDDTRYKHYKKYGMDNQSYQTQLALYCSSLNCDGAWYIGNACTGEITVIPVTLEQIHNLYKDLILRAHMVTVTCKSSQSLAEVLTKGLCPPKPRKRKDGTFYIPPELYVSKGTLHPCCSLYDFYEEDNKYYVTGLNYPVEARGSEPDWKEEL